MKLKSVKWNSKTDLGMPRQQQILETIKNSNLIYLINSVGVRVKNGLLLYSSYIWW